MRMQEDRSLEIRNVEDEIKWWEWGGGQHTG
jgi:hypothetical protein